MVGEGRRWGELACGDDVADGEEHTREVVAGEGKKGRGRAIAGEGRRWGEELARGEEVADREELARGGGHRVDGERGREMMRHTCITYFAKSKTT